MSEKSTIDIKFSDLANAETFKDIINTDIPTDSIVRVLKAYYAFQVWVYINAWDYDQLKKLEGILELHNAREGNNK